MKRNIVRTSYFATVLLAFTAVAPEQAEGACSNARLAGTWGHTLTGTLVLPGGPTPMAAVGIFTLDLSGAVAGTQTSSVGGTVSQDTLKGTITTNSDCTATFSVDLYDPSGTLLRTAVWDLVFVDNAKEMRGILTSLVLSNGVKVLPITTVNGKRL